MLVVDRVRAVAEPPEAALLKEPAGEIRRRDVVRIPRRAVEVRLRVRRLEVRDLPGGVELDVGVLPRIYVNRVAVGVVGESGRLVGPVAVVEARGVVRRDGRKVRRLGVPGPEVIDKPHLPDLIGVVEKLLKDRRHVARYAGVDDHLTDLHLAVEVVVEGLDVAQGTQRDRAARRIRLA